MLALRIQAKIGQRLIVTEAFLTKHMPTKLSAGTRDAASLGLVEVEWLAAGWLAGCQAG